MGSTLSLLIIPVLMENACLGMERADGKEYFEKRSAGIWDAHSYRRFS
jgi:hypothetical protein